LQALSLIDLEAVARRAAHLPHHQQGVALQ